MKSSQGLALGVLLIVSVACLRAYPVAQASSEIPGRDSNGPAMMSPPLRSEWRVGAASTHGSLTVFPVLSDNPERADGFITLDQGLRSGKVIITELGADGRSRRVSRRQRSNDDANVNKLALTNRSGKTLILIAGEVVVGGKQDRIVGHDCLIASSNTPVEIDVFCVEQGRWEDRPIGQSRGVGVGSGSGNGASTGRSNSFMVPGVIAAPGLREKAQAAKDQSAVWSNVTETVEVNASQSDTTTLNRVYENRNVSGKLRRYERALKQRLVARNVVGAVVAVGGTIIAADVFASPSLFQAYWPKLLKSYALQAISTRGARQREVTAGEAQTFLARAEGTKSSDGREGVYKLTEHQSSTDASFELEHAANKPALIHFNRVNKK
jgi:hypothetical protein